MAKGRGSEGGVGKVVLGFVLALVVIALGAVVYFKWGRRRWRLRTSRFRSRSRL